MAEMAEMVEMVEMIVMVEMVEMEMMTAILIITIFTMTIRRRLRGTSGEKLGLEAHTGDPVLSLGRDSSIKW